MKKKFLCDVERCIDCSGCVIACKEGNRVPVGVNRRRVVTLNQGQAGEKSISVSCMHCDDAPCVAVCPVAALSTRQDGIVLVNKKICIGCGYCFMACPFGVPQFEATDTFGARGVMDKCTFCTDGTEDDVVADNSHNRTTGGKMVRCAGMCATKALLAGDGKTVAEVYRRRVFQRGSGANPWGWDKAYRQDPDE